MKMTLNEVLETYKNLAVVVGKKLPVRLSYAVSKNLKKLESEVKLIEKSRKELVEQYCEKDEEGNAKIANNKYVFKDDNEKKFTHEYNEYLETETELDVHKILFTEIERTEEERYDILSPAELMGIGFMIEEEG